MTKWELYDTHYTERYLGNPATDPKPYQSSDALDDALKIGEPLLLIHGMSDDNVVFQNSTLLADKLQANDHPFDLMFYVGQTHRPAGEGRQAHVQKTIERFLDEKVLGATARLADRASVDQPRVEVPGRVAEPGQDEGEADE